MCFKRKKVNKYETELENELSTVKQENEALRNEIEELRSLIKISTDKNAELDREIVIQKYRIHGLESYMASCYEILDNLNPNIRLNALKDMKELLSQAMPESGVSND